MTDIMDGVVIGAAGGALAGITILSLDYLGRKIRECCEKRRVYSMLRKASCLFMAK